MQLTRLQRILHHLPSPSSSLTSSSSQHFRVVSRSLSSKSHHNHNPETDPFILCSTHPVSNSTSSSPSPSPSSPASEQHIAVLTLNNPTQKNAMTTAMSIQFERAVHNLSQDSNLAAVVLTGGPSMFSAGGDLNFLLERSKDSPHNNVVVMLQYYARFLSVRTLGVPVVCSLSGVAVGAGAALALACDMRVASPSASLSLPFVGLGLYPGMGSTHFLPLLGGQAVATRMFLTGGTVQAPEALNLGLLTQLSDDPLKSAIELAQKIGSTPRNARRQILNTLRAQSEVGLKQALEREANNQAVCYASEEFRTAVNNLYAKLKQKQ